MFRRYLEQFSYSFARFMYGRYGTDALSKTLSIAALILIVIGIFIPFLDLIGLGLMIWSIFRTYSKNIEKRRRELNKYLDLTAGVRRKYRLYTRMFRERKTHCYFKCKTCKAIIRIPKGRGELDVGCPRCKTRVKRKT